MKRVTLCVTFAAQAVEKLADGPIQQIATSNASCCGGGIEFFGECCLSSKAQRLRHAISIRHAYALAVLPHFGPSGRSTSRQHGDRTAARTPYLLGARHATNIPEQHHLLHRAHSLM